MKEPYKGFIGRIDSALCVGQRSNCLHMGAQAFLPAQDSPVPATSEVNL
jgi:hypothetical protein